MIYSLLKDIIQIPLGVLSLILIINVCGCMRVDVYVLYIDNNDPLRIAYSIISSSEAMWLIFKSRFQYNSVLFARIEGFKYWVHYSKRKFLILNSNTYKIITNSSSHSVPRHRLPAYIFLLPISFCVHTRRRILIKSVVQLIRSWCLVFISSYCNCVTKLNIAGCICECPEWNPILVTFCLAFDSVLKRNQRFWAWKETNIQH